MPDLPKIKLITAKNNLIIKESVSEDIKLSGIENSLYLLPVWFSFLLELHSVRLFEKVVLELPLLLQYSYSFYIICYLYRAKNLFDRGCCLHILECGFPLLY